MKRLTLCVLLVLAAGMAFATTAAKDLYIPAVARSTGAFGTFWTSDVRLYNPTTAPVTATLTYLPMAAFAGDATTATVPLGALETVLLENVVETTLGVATNTAGALHITAPVDIYADSRTFTPGSVGTYGQRIPGIPASQAVAAGETVNLLYIDNSADFRTNFGVADAGGVGVAYTLTGYNDAGVMIGAPYNGTVGANQWDQFNPLDKIGAGAQSNARVTFAVTSGSAMPYASQVDNASGDASFFDGTKIKGGGGGTSGCGTGLLYGYFIQFNNADWEGYISYPLVWAIDGFNLWSWQDPTPDQVGSGDEVSAVYITPTSTVIMLGYDWTAADPSEYIALSDGGAFDLSITYTYTDGTKDVLSATFHLVGTFACPNFVSGDMDSLVKALSPDYKDFAGKWYWHFKGGYQ